MIVGRDKEYIKGLLSTFETLKQVNGDAEEAMYVVARKVAKDQATMSDGLYITDSHFFPGER